MLTVLLSIWKPIVEIIFIWLLIYSLIRFFQGTRAMHVLMGLVFLAVIFNIAKTFELNAINWVLTKLFAVGVVAFLIIFQPELRRGLARIGQQTMLGGLLNEGGTIDELVKACEFFSKNKIGALIAIEREVGLRTYIESGIRLEAKVSSELLITLFDTHTPTHDGAVIISGDKIASSGSFFPLSQSVNLSRTLGTRHRAAVGITEETDVVCVIVSEETGGISISVYGKLTRDLDPEGVRRVLASLFRKAESKNPVWDYLVKHFNFFKEKTNL